MKRKLIAYLMAVTMLVGANSQAHASACPSSNYAFWMPKTGSDANDGLTMDTPKLSAAAADTVAGMGGAVYVVTTTRNGRIAYFTKCVR